MDERKLTLRASSSAKRNYTEPLSDIEEQQEISQEGTGEPAENSIELLEEELNRQLKREEENICVLEISTRKARKMRDLKALRCKRITLDLAHNMHSAPSSLELSQNTHSARLTTTATNFALTAAVEDWTGGAGRHKSRGTWITTVCGVGKKQAVR